MAHTEKPHDDEQAAINDEARLSEDEAELFQQLSEHGASRREFLGYMSAAGMSLFAMQKLAEQEALAAGGLAPNSIAANEINPVAVKVRINGALRTLNFDARVTLLDALREKLALTGTKKGCDHGQCGACTVLVDGRRVLSCLTLTAQVEGQSVTTIEGLAQGDELHPLQAAFIKHDGFQCGYCTPGQICSAVALLEEAKRGEASHVTEDVSATTTRLTDEEIRERMSGNLCRCGAYPKIIAAIQEVHSGKETSQTWAFAGEKREGVNETV